MEEEIARIKKVGFFSYEGHGGFGFIVVLEIFLLLFSGSESLRIRLEYPDDFPHTEPVVSDHDKVFTPSADGHQFPDYSLCLRFPGREAFNKDGPMLSGEVRKKYRPGTVDFFAILLIPVDDWYIIPFEVVGRTNSTLHFSPESKRGKYREYREAWDLLWGGGLTIQACCDAGWCGEDRGRQGFLDFARSSVDADDLATMIWLRSK